MWLLPFLHLFTLDLQLDEMKIPRGENRPQVFSLCFAVIMSAGNIAKFGW